MTSMDVPQHDPLRREVDHRLPFSVAPELLGDSENWRVLCRECNRSRQNQTDEEFLARRRAKGSKAGGRASSGGGLIRCPGDGLAAVSVRELDRVRGAKHMRLVGDNRCEACRATYVWSRVWHSQPCR